MNKLKHLLSLLMLICFSVGNVWATGANTLATYEFTNGTTMPTNVSNSGGVAFATTRFCFDSNNDNIVITPTIPQNATTLYIAVKGFMNSTSASAGTIGIYGLSSTNAAVSGASGTYTQSTGSATNATGCDNAATDEDEISFSATGVAKIKINCDTYSKKYIIRTVTITYDTNGGGSQEPTGFLNQVCFLSSYISQLMVISKASRRQVEGNSYPTTPYIYKYISREVEFPK